MLNFSDNDDDYDDDDGGMHRRQYKTNTCSRLCIPYFVIRHYNKLPANVNSGNTINSLKYRNVR